MSLPQFETNRIFTHLALALGGSLLILAGLLYTTSNAGHDINPTRLFELIKNSSIGYFALYVLTMFLGLLIRAWRYLVLLRATGERQLPSYGDMMLITAVRNMTVDLLPARLGELVFVALLRKRAGTQISAGLSTLLFATMLDILVLAPFTIGIGLMVGFPNKQPYLYALVALGVVFAFIVGVKFILPHLRGWLQRYSDHPNKLISGLFGFAMSIDEAVESTMKAGVFTKVTVLTVMVRFLKYAGLLSLFYGLTQQSFPAMADLGSLKVLGALIASEMTASLPVPALMSFGTWEIGGMTLLAFFGAMPQDALLTMLGLHVQTQALDYGIGIVALAALFLFARRGGAALVKKKGRNGLLAIFVVLAAGLSWFGFDALNGKRAEYDLLAQGTFVRPADSPIPAWLKEVNGMIVWSSSRSGNHDIWLMSLPDLKIQPFTTDPHTENFARISPDGKKVVFARSHKEWQSLRDFTPWDIWVKEIASGKEKMLAKWGIAPSWSPDGSFVTFQRNPGKVMAVDVKTGKERLHYESGKDPFMKSRVDLATPSVGMGQRMAFTFRNHGQPTNIIRDEIGQFQLVHRDSCQVEWSPSGEFATYIQKGGKQVNQIMRFDPKTQKKTTLLDMSGEYSHEYFPRLSEDEKYIVFAASTGAQEHDLADYEIFLWPMGGASDAAERLTFNSKNDSWPDIWLQ